jgi:hypothetical protein
MKFPLNRETICTCLKLKRDPRRGSLLVARVKVFAPSERLRGSFLSVRMYVSLPCLEVRHVNPAA